MRPLNIANAIAVGLLMLASSIGVAQSSPNRANGPALVPVPRTSFLAAMDAEFRKIDQNKNGVLTRAEIQSYERTAAALETDARRQALFSGLDRDKNGVLSPAEFASMPIQPVQPNASPVLTQSDLNHDGAIGLVEYRTAKLVNFDRMDTDKDGVVSLAEMKAAGLAK